jgi:hypothetical protein
MKEFDFRTIDNILDIIDNELAETQCFQGTGEFIALLERITTTKSALRKEIFKRYREIGIVRPSPPSLPCRDTLSLSVSHKHSLCTFLPPSQWAEIPVTAYGKQIDSNSRASVVVESLRSANMVVDTLGEETVGDLIDALVQAQILSYQIRAGYEGGELFGLEKEMLEKRWEELYRLLGSSSAPHMQRIMSSEWDITFKLYVEFCRRTAQHLERLLDKEVKKITPSTSNSAPPPSPSAYSRRSTSQTSLNDATADSGNDSSATPSVPGAGAAEVDPAALQEHGNFVVQILKSVLATEQEVHKMFDDGVFALSASGYVSAPAGSQTASNRCFLMSSLFDKFLDPFVQSERRNVQELIQSLVAEDIRLITPDPPSDQQGPSNNTPTKGNHSAQQPASTKEEVVDLIAYTSACQRVFNSAEMIFQTIRSSLLRCASFSSGVPLLTLVHEYKVCFQIYAETLRSSLCPVIPPSAPRVGRRRAFLLTLDEEVLACRAVITAERCASLIPQIQTEVSSKLLAQHASDAEMRAQSELFEDVTYHGVNVLVGSLLGKANESLVYMVATPWAKISVVGDCSPYIRMLHQMLTTRVPRLRKVLSWKCFDALCYRFSSDLLDHFLALIMGLKKIGVVGAEQLLLDTNELKPLLMKLHHTSLPLKSLERQTMQVPETFLEMVTKKARLIEVVLKLICSDDEHIESTFYLMWPEGQEGDLKSIKALKASMQAASKEGDSSSHGGGGHYEDGLSSHDTSLPTSAGGGFGAAMLGSLGNLSSVGNLRAKASNLTDRFKLGAGGKK